MQKSLVIDAGKCTGCLQCELACSYQGEGVFNPARSRIKIFNFHDQGRFVPYTCTQCDEAWCLHACPVEAITMNKATGAMEVEGENLDAGFGRVEYAFVLVGTGHFTLQTTRTLFRVDIE